MIRTADYKYVCYSTGADHEQLFDLSQDPGEMNDLSSQSKHRATLATHRKLLADYIRETGDFFPLSQVG